MKDSLGFTKRINDIVWSHFFDQTVYGSLLLLIHIYGNLEISKI